MPEIGSLRALANGESQFVGSSSGVYFINTVRRAFSAHTSATADASQRTNDVGAELRDDPSPEDCIVGAGGDDETEQDENADNAGHHESHPQSHDHLSPLSTGSDFINDMSKLPDYSTARKLVMTYFRIWHPLVPFLQGPECLAELDALYASTEHDRRNVASLSRLVIFRDPIKLRSATHPEPLGSTSDACSIQALLSAQVYFISVMSLRHASSVGGLISKSIFQSGMHRCPVRYGHLSPDERSMRKRIFWSFYVLDRFGIGISTNLSRNPHFLPQVLQQTTRYYIFQPITSKDVRNPEIKEITIQIHQQKWKKGTKTQLQIAKQTPVRPKLPPFFDTVKRLRTSFKTTSIHARDTNNQTILFLKADVAAWGNDLTEPRPGSTLTNIPELNPDPTVFPFITYHYTVLLLNRPSLSLDSRCAEFRAALQTCISAAKAIIPTVEQYHQTGEPLFWPGYMSAVWMSGLVLALAARVKSYSLSRAKS
ncbi:C6 transcription factor [Colletotrichum kahawae]|uniref:C6 transcription factor n=1 Tax=Colletotrichum kahawae TaxID=34407 RepID=A0AAD9Y2B4_COLKA|nr:C6 transcription factor [Colletotrichum kahawae]